MVHKKIENSLTVIYFREKEREGERQRDFLFGKRNKEIEICVVFTYISISCFLIELVLEIFFYMKCKKRLFFSLRVHLSIHLMGVFTNDLVIFFISIYKKKFATL